MISLSLIIVTYNHAATVGRTLASLARQRLADYEVILLDNASSDASLAVAREFRDEGRLPLRVLASRVNRGFAGGNNDAAGLARGELLLFCNPDVEFDDPDVLARLVALYRAEPTLGIVGFKLFFPDRRTLQHCGGTIEWPAHTPLRGYGEPDAGQYDAPAEVAFVEGSALALPRALWRRLGGFDELYWPAFYEETDLCLRARRLGLRVTYRPELAAIHDAPPKAATVTDGWFWRTLQTHRLLFTWRALGPWQLLRALPGEARWLFRPEMRYLRAGVYRAYLRAAKRLLLARAGRSPAPGTDFVELTAAPPDSAAAVAS